MVGGSIWKHSVIRQLQYLPNTILLNKYFRVIKQVNPNKTLIFFKKVKWIKLYKMFKAREEKQLKIGKCKKERTKNTMNGKQLQIWKINSTISIMI